MKTEVASGLNSWSKDLEASSDVVQREVPALAMLLGRVKGCASRDQRGERLRLRFSFLKSVLKIPLRWIDRAP